MFASEEARRGPLTRKLVDQVLDRCIETFEVGADQTFYTLRRISNITSLDQAQLFQHTIQALENFVLAIKSASKADTLKAIAKPSLVDDRLPTLDQRLTTMAHQYQTGLIHGEAGIAQGSTLAPLTNRETAGLGQPTYVLENGTLNASHPEARSVLITAGFGRRLTRWSSRHILRSMPKPSPYVVSGLTEAAAETAYCARKSRPCRGWSPGTARK